MELLPNGIRWWLCRLPQGTQAREAEPDLFIKLNVAVSMPGADAGERRQRQPQDAGWAECVRENEEAAWAAEQSGKL